MLAKLAYLTSPAPDRYVLNFQSSHGVNFAVEISRAHLANIIIDGASFSLRETSINRVPHPLTGGENERAGA
jgi:hypothetical protein